MPYQTHEYWGRQTQRTGMIGLDTRTQTRITDRNEHISTCNLCMHLHGGVGRDKPYTCGQQTSVLAVMEGGDWNAGSGAMEATIPLKHGGDISHTQLPENSIMEFVVPQIRTLHTSNRGIQALTPYQSPASYMTLISSNADKRVHAY